MTEKKYIETSEVERLCKQSYIQGQKDLYAIIQHTIDVAFSTLQQLMDYKKESE